MTAVQKTSHKTDVQTTLHKKDVQTTSKQESCTNKTVVQTTSKLDSFPDKVKTRQLYKQIKQDSCTNNVKQDSCIDIKTGQMYKQRQTRHVPSTSNKTVVQQHQNKTYQTRHLCK